MSQFVVGITGGIGAGKSAVTEILENFAIDVVDADLVARKVVEPGADALAQVKAAFGADMLMEDGGLNRAKMRELVFSDDSAKQKLNAIMHPAIRSELLRQLNSANSQYAVLSAPLLIENNLEQYVDKLVVVDVPEALQLARASSRDDVSKEQIKAIMASQSNREDRLAKADMVIDNSSDLVELQQQVTKLHEQLLAMAQA